MNLLHMAMLALAVVFYMRLMRTIAERESESRPETDEAFLARTALMEGVSEYRLFHRAAETWNVSAPRIEEDFKVFVTEGPMPHYVRDFIRRQRRRSHAENACGPDCPPLGSSSTP